VISNLGGSPQDVTCPWCSGTGMRQPETDAQAAWRERQEAAAAGTPATETSSDAGNSGQADAAGSPPQAGSEQGKSAAAEPATGENAS